MLSYITLILKLKENLHTNNKWQEAIAIKADFTKLLSISVQWFSMLKTWVYSPIFNIKAYISRLAGQFLVTSLRILQGVTKI